MPAASNLTGKWFGRLKVIGRAPKEADRIGRVRWTCRCACGATVTPTTNDLTSGRYHACPDCGGPRPRRLFASTCLVCGKVFVSPNTNAITCSNECRQDRRRGLAHGVEHMPKQTRECVVCGKPFLEDRNLLCCSDECLRERDRRKALESYYSRTTRDPGLNKKMAARKRLKAASDPEYAEAMRRWEQAKREKHRARMASDPEYAARFRARMNEQYRRDRDKIMAQRRARLDAMTPERRERWMERTRRSCREYRRKFYAELRADPEAHQRHIDLMREYKRQRNRRRQIFEAARLAAEFESRGEL